MARINDLDELNRLKLAPNKALAVDMSRATILLKSIGLAQTRERQPVPRHAQGLKEMYTTALALEVAGAREETFLECTLCVMQAGRARWQEGR